MRAAVTATLAAVVIAAGCDGGSGGGDVSQADTRGGDVQDTVADTATVDTSADTAGDTGPPLTEPGRFVLGTAELSNEHVFKSVWAGEDGVIVAVGNEGVVASRDASGEWSVLTRAEGAELLNGVHGVDGDSLWAVGKNGTILTGTRSSFGGTTACSQHQDCEDFDACTIDLCIEGVCVAESSGLSGCCGFEAGRWDFESGELGGWSVIEQTGALTWQVVDLPNRSASGQYSLYFGDPAASPPSYDTGFQVAGVALSPPFTLPRSGTATLEFEAFVDIEPDAAFDVFAVEVVSGSQVVQVWHKSDLAAIPTPGFVHAEADLTPWSGKTVNLRFRFNSIDGTFNILEGVYVDDVAVSTRCVAAGAATTSVGPTLWGVYAVARDLAFAVGREGTLLRYDGVRWAPAKGNDASAVWNGIWGVDDALAIVGNNGSVSVTRDGGLNAVATGTTANIHGVHTVDGQTFWAAGDQGTLLRGEGAQWVRMSSGTQVSLRDIFAVSNDDVYAVGFIGTVLHWDGVRWTRLVMPVADDILAVWGEPSGRVTLAGRNGVILEGNAADGFSLVGTFHSGGELVDIWGTPEGARFVVGSRGRIVSYIGGSWASSESGTDQALQGVFGFDTSDVWAVGRAGTVLHYSEGQWTRTESPSSAALNAVWGPRPDLVYAAGSGGALIVWNGVQWTNLISSTDANLRAVYGRHARDIWAVGAKGTIMHYGGIGWAQSPVETTKYEDGTEEPVVDELHAIWAAADDDAWAVGANGRMLRWDGSIWAQIDNEIPFTMRGIYGLAPNDIWVVGNQGFAMHFNGEVWEPMETGSIATLHHIHGDGVGHVVAVGDIGTVLELERDAATE